MMDGADLERVVMAETSVGQCWSQGLTGHTYITEVGDEEGPSLVSG